MCSLYYLCGGSGGVGAQEGRPCSLGKGGQGGQASKEEEGGVWVLVSDGEAAGGPSVDR